MVTSSGAHSSIPLLVPQPYGTFPPLPTRCTGASHATPQQESSTKALGTRTPGRRKGGTLSCVLHVPLLLACLHTKTTDICPQTSRSSARLIISAYASFLPLKDRAHVVRQDSGGKEQEATNEPSNFLRRRCSGQRSGEHSKSAPACPQPPSLHAECTYVRRRKEGMREV